jgi:hypothetical protein
MKIKEFFRSKFINIKGWFITNKPMFSYLFDLVLEIVIYGFLINMPMKFIFGREFNWFTFPSYGILFYFIKYEFVKLWSQIFPKK